jgi:hypothetical protein
MTAFLVGFVVGGAVVGVLTILVGPSRRVRAEPALDDEVETRLLLGLEPEPQDADVVPMPHPRDYDTSQLRELEDLGKAPKKRKRKAR